MLLKNKVFSDLNLLNFLRRVFFENNIKLVFYKHYFYLSSFHVHNSNSYTHRKISLFSTADNFSKDLVLFDFRLCLSFLILVIFNYFNEKYSNY